MGPHIIQILLIEDAANAAETLSSHLLSCRKAQYNLSHTSTIEGALENLNNNAYDLVLLDLDSQGDQGIEWFEKIRKLCNNTAIIIQTSQANEKAALEAVDKGAIDYIIKEKCNPDLICRVLYYAFEGKLQEKELESRRLFEQTITGISSYLISLGSDEIDIGVIRTLQSVQNYGEVDRCHLTVFTDDGHIEKIYEYCTDDVVPRINSDTKKFIQSELPWFFEEIQGFGEVMLSSPADFPEGTEKDQQYFKYEGLKSIVAIPLIDKDSVKAFISFETVHRERKWLEDHIAILRVVGEILLNFRNSKLLEKTIIDNEKVLNTILNTIQTGILVVNKEDLNVSNCNNAACEIIKGEKEDLKGVHLEYFIPSMVDNDSGLKFDKELPQNIECQLKTLNGRELIIILSITNITIDSQAHIVICFIDITERKIVELELAQDQKLKSIGSLAAGIAHEINTPTQFISDNTRFLNDAFGDLMDLIDQYDSLKSTCSNNEDPRELIENIDRFIEDIDLSFLRDEVLESIEQSLTGLERVSSIVNAMRDYSHPEMKEKRPADINKVIMNAITVGRNEWKYSSEIITKFDPALPAVPCHSGELGQVILNMVINAVHAIEDAKQNNRYDMGEIRIATKTLDDLIEISISDNGDGIAEENVGRIFDPFYTTKDVGKGTGQGLALVRKIIIEKHGGTINLDSEIGKGTTFYLRLPVECAVQDEADINEKILA